MRNLVMDIMTYEDLHNNVKDGNIAYKDEQLS